MMEEKNPQFSYSRIEQYENCPRAYDLKYNQKKFYDPETIITAIGTCIHDCEEHISLSLMEGKSPHYDDLIDRLYNVNIPKKDKYDTEGGIFGINIIKQKFPLEFYEPSEKTGLSYFNKVTKYVKNIHRQEDYLLAHPELELYDVEHAFNFQYGGYYFKGFIDRILKYKGTNRFVIHDIKTKDRLFDAVHAKTPLQFVLYSIGLSNELSLLEMPDECYWDLVFIQQMQQAGTKGFLKRGMKKLDKLLAGIEEGDYVPKPSPLCYWCAFSNTNPKVTEEGRNQCPYYCKWTPQTPKDFSKMFEWAGPEMVDEHIVLLTASNKQKKYGGFVL